ncbi:MAG: PH domain-containing protein, partial [Oscillospiraceae bacterium]
MNELKHQHPLVVIFYIWKFAILLILPLFRGFIGALTGDFSSWARGAWFDILVVAAIFVFGAVKWNSISYKVTENDIFIKRGMFIKQNFTIPFEKVTTFSYINSFFLKPFGCASIYFDTPAGTSRKADMHLFLNKYEAKKLLLLQSCYLGEKSYPKGHRTKNWYVLFISALTSNSFAGVVLFAAFISQIGEILGSEFSDILYGQFEQLGEKLSFGLPPTTAAIAYIVLAGWFITFIIN